MKPTLNKPLKQTLAKRIESISRLHGEFTLRSGLVSDTYFDKYRFEADPILLKNICEALIPLLPSSTRVLGGLEMGGIPIATVLSQLTGLPTAFLRKEAKSYGTCRYAEGVELPIEGITLVEDVVSSGGAILDQVTRLHADGLQPDVAVCVIDRETGGAEALADAGIELRALLTMSELVSDPD